MIAFHVKAVRDDKSEYPSGTLVLETFLKAEQMEDFFNFYPRQTFRVTTLSDDPFDLIEPSWEFPRNILPE